MSLNLNEILESGLIELYVLGTLSGQELKDVEAAIQKYPELKQEIFEIEKALHNYDALHKVKPPKGSLDKILSKIDQKPTLTPTNEKEAGFSKWPVLCALLGALLLASVYYYFSTVRSMQSTIQEQAQLIRDCENEKEQNDQQQNLFASITNLESRKVLVSPTEKYPETALAIYINPITKKNYLQISQLPPLADNQSFQLWSLKGDNPPSPLDVFENDLDAISEVGFIEASNAYAITIEPRGGSQTPTLENLIGVFSI